MECIMEVTVTSLICSSTTFWLLSTLAQAQAGGRRQSKQGAGTSRRARAQAGEHKQRQAGCGDRQAGTGRQV
ncbi:hypothetical protein BJV74DRAFT_849393 [Russula compacta]|nr:hypothetical protein BJV74DRAFT_849393 [Russula compacta]